MGKAKSQNASKSTTAAMQPAKQVISKALQLHEEYYVHTEWLEMKDIAEESGLPHAGYLVLQWGEKVKVLYLGSEATGDVDWAYGEVITSIPPEDAGRRGWLPRSVIDRQNIETAPAKKTPQNGKTDVKASDGGYTAGTTAANNLTKSADSGPGPPAQAVRLEAYVKRDEQQRPSQPRQISAPSVQPVARKPGGLESRIVPPEKATLADALLFSKTRRIGKKKAGPSDRQSPTAATSREQEAFPALSGHTGRSRQEEAEEVQERAPAPTKKKQEKEVAPPPRDVAGTIERHRALAAAAAANAAAAATAAAKGKKSKSKVETECKICYETFTPQRRRAQLPCCGVEMCAQCSEKSLRSKTCYFCRAEAPEFPLLASAAGF